MNSARWSLLGTALIMLIPTDARAQVPPLPQVCEHPAQAVTTIERTFSGLPTSSRARAVMDLVRSVLARGDSTQASSLSDTAARRLPDWVAKDSLEVFRGLGEMVVSSPESNEREATLAAYLYSTLKGLANLLFAMEKTQFGFDRRADILSAITGHLDAGGQAVVRDYACDAVVMLFASTRDSTYWDQRIGFPDRLNDLFILRHSYELMDRVYRHQFDDAIVFLLGDEGRQFVQDATKQS
ncbi:MAG: hypothetical protein ACREL4_11435 [Gemmatimonadales bacterium]